MAVSKVGSMVNSQLLEAGARSGFDSVMVGSGLGAGVGAINGSFSDYEGVFSGAMKGAVVGGIAGGGLKTLGSRYAANYEKKVSQFTNDQTSHLSETFNKDFFGLDTKLFNKNYGGIPEDASMFNDEFGGGLAALREAGAKKSESNRLRSTLGGMKFTSGTGNTGQGAPFMNSGFPGTNF